MFDIGFSEIVVIGVVALIVIGPEKLPKTARTLGHLFGRMQRYVNDVKSDIRREMDLEELRRIQSEVQSAAQAIESSVTDAARAAESGVREVERDLHDERSAMQAIPGDGEAPTSTSMNPPLAEPPSTDAVATDPGADAQPPRQSTLPGFERG